MIETWPAYAAKVRRVVPAQVYDRWMAEDHDQADDQTEHKEQ